MDKKAIMELYDKDSVDFENTRYGGVGGEIYLEIQNEIVFSLLGSVKNESILELGIGTGVYAKAISRQGGIVYGLDLSTEMLKQIRTSAEKISLISGDMENIPIQSNSMDAIICIRAIRLLSDLNKALIEINRVLKPSGIFVFNFHNTSPLRWRIGELRGYGKEKMKYDMPYEEMIKDLKNCGFRLLKSIGTMWVPFSFFKSLNRNKKDETLATLLKNIEKVIDTIFPSKQAQLVFMCAKKEDDCERE